MKPVEQTVLMPPGGNCFAACMASILELPLETMPDFTPFDDWTVRWNRWLRPMNLAIMHTSVSETNFEAWRQECMPGYTIPAVESPRGPWLHAVVALDGELVWDPHPERCMGVGAWREVTYFYVIDPCAHMQIGYEPTDIVTAFAELREVANGAFDHIEDVEAHVTEIRSGGDKLVNYLMDPMKQMPCVRCHGCGRIANSDDGEAWTYWEQLKPGEDLAVRAGIVKPIPCPTCGGSGSIEVPEIKGL
jgi:hypothetical protein